MSIRKFSKTIVANAIGSTIGGVVVGVWLTGNPPTMNPVGEWISVPDVTPGKASPNPTPQTKNTKRRVGDDSGSSYKSLDPGYTDYRYTPKRKSNRLPDRQSLGYVDTAGDNLGYVDTYTPEL